MSAEPLGCPACSLHQPNREAPEHDAAKDNKKHAVNEAHTPVSNNKLASKPGEHPQGQLSLYHRSTGDVFRIKAADSERPSFGIASLR